MYYISPHKCLVLFTAGPQEMLDCFSCHLLSSCHFHSPHINIILSPPPPPPPSLINWKVYFRPSTANTMTNIRKSQTHFPWKWWKCGVTTEIERERERYRCMYMLYWERTVSQCQNNWEPRAHISFVGAGLHFLMENILANTTCGTLCLCNSNRKKKNEMITYN